MKNRFSKMGKSLLGAVCVLSSCVFTYSCTDDYDLPDRKPDFLGASIYDELKARGTFNTTVKLIDDLEYAEVLSKTGSKTLFVAPDSAFKSFFATTKWTDAYGNPVRSYEQLSLAQKKLLINGTMLNNAYVMEMLSNTEGGGKNLCLRQQTAASILDTVPYFKVDELPILTNPNDKNFWTEEHLDTEEGIYLALDQTKPYMTHFLEGYMRNYNITKEDVAVVLNQRGADKWTNDGEDRSYIYGHRVIEQDVTCLNGYFNVLDGVLVQPSNMAEEIRISGITNHFSHLLDRFSAPYLSEQLTFEYQALHPDVTAVYEKRYFSTRSQNNNSLTIGPDKEPIGDYSYLPYDPGWNTYKVSDAVAAESDMGAMFVPNDSALLDFFRIGTGKAYIERYAEIDDASTVLTHENFNEYTDKIPLNIIHALVNNLMKISFNESVPSKYLTIMNDARDPMFTDYSKDEYVALFDSCILANNGVVYIMNKVISPADYSAVSAPVLTSGQADVVNKIITVDDRFQNGSEYASAPLQQYFSTYLKSMQSSFSFFVPTDEALETYGYADPACFSTNRTGRLSTDEKVKFTLDTKATQNLPITMKSHGYTIKTDKLDRTATPHRTSEGSATSGTNYELKKKLLVDMVNQHIVVHEDNNDMVGVQNVNRKFFEARNGAPVIIYDHKVSAGAELPADVEGMVVGGGFQYMVNNTPDYTPQYCNVTKVYNQSRTNGYGNGMTYFLDRPMEPTYQSVYKVLKSNPEFSKFFELVDGRLDQEYLVRMGYRDDEMTDDEWEVAWLRYQIMVAEDDQTQAHTSYYPPLKEELVRLFNNYRYTVYVPTNEVLEKAIENGFPTWERIEAFVDERTDTLGVLPETAQDSARCMLEVMLNALRYHFQDKAVYVDGYDVPMEEYQTSSLDEVDNVYRSVNVKQSQNAITVNGVNVTDKNNLLARDINFDERLQGSVDNDGTPSVFTTSSFVVLHQIDGMLDFANEGGAVDYSTFDWTSFWASPAKAKANAAKYKISK